jgi:tRNA(fMet)-specific endonuclease VapC
MLDTNIFIYIIKRQPESVLERFSIHSVGEIGISVITLAELEYGVSKSSNPTRNRSALEQFILPLQVAPFDRPATFAYATVRATLEKKGNLMLKKIFGKMSQ